MINRFISVSESMSLNNYDVKFKSYIVDLTNTRVFILNFYLGLREATDRLFLREVLPFHAKLV